MAELDDLKTAVGGMESQLSANKTLLQDVKAKLDALTSAGTPIDPAEVEAIAQQIAADTASLAADDAANTPAP